MGVRVGAPKSFYEPVTCRNRPKPQSQDPDPNICKAQCVGSANYSNRGQLSILNLDPRAQGCVRLGVS